MPSLGVTSLIFSLIALSLGPLLYARFRHDSRVLAGLDGFVLVAVGAMVVLHILPAALHDGGGWSVLFILLGLALPSLMERFTHSSTHRVHSGAITLGLVALAIHASVDGIALGNLHRGVEGALPMSLAVVLHRIPVGLAVWLLVRPDFGRPAAGLVLALVAMMTGVGFFAGEELVSSLDPAGFAWFQAFVGGSLVHVLFHRHEHHQGHEHAHEHESEGEHDHEELDEAAASSSCCSSVAPALSTSCSSEHEPEPEPSCCASEESTPAEERFPGWSALRVRFPENLGALAGAALVGAVTWVESRYDIGAHVHHEAGHFGERFIAYALETSPALVFGFLLAGLVSSLLPGATMSWLNRGGRFSQASRGVALGLPLPICSCGVVPVYRSLVARGASPAAAAAFLVATPEIGVEAFLLSVPLLGWKFTWIRLAAAALCALLVALVVTSFARGGAAKEDESAQQRRSLRAGLRYALVNVVDDTAPWIVAGLLVAAAIEPSSLQGVLGGLNPYAELAVFGLLGVPIYVCASGATPLAAALIAAGASPGAALVFLLAGPATNVTTFGILRQSQGRTYAVMFAVTLLIGAMAAGAVVNVAFGDLNIPAIGHHHDHGVSALRYVALVVIALLFAWSLLRRGARSWLSSVFTAQS